MRLSDNDGEVMTNENVFDNFKLSYNLVCQNPYDYKDCYLEVNYVKKVILYNFNGFDQTYDILGLDLCMIGHD